MTRPCLIQDALWHCLCPSFGTRLLRRLPPRFTSSTAAPSDSATTIRRPYIRAVRIDTQGHFHDHRSRLKAIRKHANYKKLAPGLPPPSRSLAGPTIAALRADDVTTAELYTLLRRYASKGSLDDVDMILDKLTRERGEMPNARLYAALVLVNVNKERGSAAGATAVLEEMAAEGLLVEEEILHDVLKVLAIHPDALLRGQVLAEMKERWIALTGTGWHDVVAGYVKDVQPEQALEALSEMRQRGVEVQGWLYDMVTFMLCDLGDLDEACELIKYRLSIGSNVSFGVWYHVFDTACTWLDYGCLRLIWRRRVDNYHLTPSSGQCFAVLNAAARHGDVQLASDVFRLLGERGTSFEPQHYEMLIEAYVHAGDLRASLAVLCIMAAAGTRLSERSTRALAKHMTQSAELPTEAFEILTNLHGQGRSVPLAAVNCVLEASVELNMLDQAMQQYQRLRQLHAAGPNIATFNILFKGCKQSRRKDLAMFLAAELLALKLAPNVLTYERLLLTCLQETDYEDAFRYHEEMKMQGFVPNQGTLVAMVHRCCETGDERAWGLLEAMKAAQYDESRTRAWLMQHWREKKTAGESAVAAGR